MFIAMDNNQKRWNCMEEIPAVTEGPFYCLACHSPVRLKNGSVLRAHFAHVELQHCPYHHEAESFEHLELKASLYDWASKESHTEVESYLADFQQIADLLVVDKNLALEVQCSSLSLERLKERSDAYRSNGYHVYWLLGKKLWLKERLTKLQAGFLYFSQNRGFHLWELDLTKKSYVCNTSSMRIYEGDCIIKQKFSLLVKGLYWKSYGPLIFRNPCSKWQSSSIVHF